MLSGAYCVLGGRGPASLATPSPCRQSLCGHPSLAPSPYSTPQTPCLGQKALASTRLSPVHPWSLWGWELLGAAGTRPSTPSSASAHTRPGAQAGAARAPQGAEMPLL